MRRNASWPIAAGILALAWPLPAAESPAIPPAKAVVSDGRDVLVLGFDVLASFPYEMPPLPVPGSGSEPVAKPERIPVAVRAFSGRRAAVTGFMLPLELKEGRAKQFVLVRNQASCCYGLAPNLNEYVLVTMAGAGVRPEMDVPVTVVGTLKVGETYENGLLVGIYQLDGDKLGL
jgi:hypothetical protein